MKKRYATTAGLLLLALATMTACSSAADDASHDTDEALSGGQGPCGAPVLQVIVKAREHRFGINHQQVALNPDIPIHNICLNGVKAQCKAACVQAEAAAVATGVKGFTGDNVPAQLRAMGRLADAFNAALGNKSDFADHPVDQDPGIDPSHDPNASTSDPPPPVVSADAGAANGGGSGAAAPPPPAACNATILQVIVRGKEHRFGFDGQQVALNPSIPIANICQNRVNAQCKATCTGAANAAAASGVKGFSGDDDPVKLRAMGVLADTFNAALGDRTDFTDDPILQ
jgi:hypothetical protein